MALLKNYMIKVKPSTVLYYNLKDKNPHVAQQPKSDTDATSNCLYFS